MFNLCYNSLNYWFEWSGMQSDVVKKQAEIIRMYQEITGIQSQDKEDLRRIHEEQKAIEYEKDKELERLRKFEKRSKKVGRPVLVGFGAVIGSAITYTVVKIFS